MKGMILAAGYGQRLNPLSHLLPKPLMPVANRPMLEHTIRFLRQAGVGHLAINLHHLPQPIMERFGKGTAMGVEVTYSVEPTILGTAGGVKQVEHFFAGETFVVMNSDILIDLDLQEVLRFHRDHRALATLVVREDAEVGRYGALGVDGDGRIRSFLGVLGGMANGARAEALRSVMFTGLQILQPEILQRIPPGVPCGTSESLYPQLVREQEAIYAFVTDGYWRDLGSHGDYLLGHRELLQGHLPYLPLPPQLEAGIWVDANVVGLEEAQLIPPLLIGPDCKLMGENRIGPHVVLGQGCTLGPEATLRECVLWDGVTVGPRVEIEHCIIASGAWLEEGHSCSQQVVMRDGYSSLPIDQGTWGGRR